MKELSRKLRHVHPKTNLYKGGFTYVTFCPQCYTVEIDREKEICGHCDSPIQNDLMAKWIDTTPKLRVFDLSTWSAPKSGKWQFTVHSRQEVQQIARGVDSLGGPSRSLNFTQYDPYDLDFTK